MIRPRNRTSCFALFERMFDSWLRGYEWALDRVLARKAMMLVVTLATLAGTVALYMVVPKGFFPQEDTGFLTGITEAATDTSFEAMTVRQKALVGHPEPGSRGRLHQQHRRRRRTESDRQFRPAVHRPEAEEGPRGGARRDGASAPEGDAGSGHAGVLPEHPEPQHRRPAVKEPVSVHPAERRYRSRSTGWRRKCATRSPRCRACSTSPPISTSRTRR